MTRQFIILQAWLKDLRDSERGATAVEYGLIIALIAAVIVATVVLLGQDILAAFNKVETSIKPATP